MPISVPNLLTIARILLTPVFMIFLLKDMIVSAMLVFIFAGISDALDGLVARYFNQRTTLGAFLDPIADKLLLMASFISLAVLKMIPSWISVVVISRDVLIVIGIATLSISDIRFEIRPSFISKCTTTIQIVTVFYILITALHPIVIGLKPALIWTTAVLTIVSGLHYIYIGMNILQSGSEDIQQDR